MTTRPAPSWDAERYARTARFVSDLGAPLVEVLAPRAGERILDLGCGDGALSAEIAARGSKVVGVDTSPTMVAAARARGIDARLMEGEALAFSEAFDAVFSNAALHWIDDADAVLTSIHRALRPTGRFVAELGGAGNVAAVQGALHAALTRRGLDARAFDPWYFPTAEDYAERLDAHGFRVERMALFDRPTPLPGPLGDWLATFAESFLAAVPADDRAGLAAEVEAAVAPRLRDGQGRWVLDYRRLRFLARR